MPSWIILKSKNRKSTGNKEVYAADCGGMRGEMKKAVTSITDDFWLRYRTLVREEMLPFQWKVLNDIGEVEIERERADESLPCEKSHAIANFEIAAGRKKGEHYGWVFQDSDVYKWLEAAAYSLREKEDKQLKEWADFTVDLIADAQCSDGYLNTYFTIKCPERRYQRLAESHELYCAGHFLEAAAAYHQATGNEKVLHTAVKLADHLDRTFGPQEGKLHGYDGHEEVKIGLMKLYDITGEDRYLRLARYFLDIRGVQEKEEDNFLRQQYLSDGQKEEIISGMRQMPLKYFQAAVPFTEMKTAQGHAVRQVYLCNGAARVAQAMQDQELKETCERLWDNITKRQMYITGGIGATVNGESFTFDYDLPNDTMYCETCASIGLIFFARQMLKLSSRGVYADVMERALYNTCLAGMALDGKHFFYVNPLSADPKSYAGDPTKSHVKPKRPQWLGCACCPPNLARLLASLEEYVYIQKENEILSALFMNCESTFPVSNGSLHIRQETDYPWEGTVKYFLNYTENDEDIEAEKQLEGQDNSPRPVTFGIRIPDWAETAMVRRNGKETKMDIRDGFCYFERLSEREEIELELPMNINRWYANANIKDDVGKTALSRGPFVYCLEEADNGPNLHLLELSKGADLEYRFERELLKGVGTITAKGLRRQTGDQEQKAHSEQALYYKNAGPGETKSVKMKFIPYYAWANRGENEMQIWTYEE